MTTTITREERERVAKLLGYAPGTLGLKGIADGLGDVDSRLAPEDIDRVAQALRDAEGEALRKVVDHLGGDVVGKRTATMADVMEIVEAHEDRARQAAAPQWREVTETEPAIGKTVLVTWDDEDDCHPEVVTLDEDGDFLASDGLAFEQEPTHWMPLPTPPKPDHSKRIAELEAEIARLKAEQ